MTSELLTIHFRNISNRRIAAYAATYGVPLGEAVLLPGQNLSLRLENGEGLPLQTKPLETHFDGSIKWMLLDFSLPLEANQTGTLILEKSETPAATSKLSVEENAETITVSTSRLKASFSKTKFSLFNSYRTDERELMRNGSDIVLEDANGKLFYASLCEKIETRIIENGTQRVVVEVSGRHTAEDDSTLLDFRLRYTFRPDEPGVLLSYKFTNREDAERGVVLRAMRIEMACDIGDKTTKFARQTNHGKEWFSRRVTIGENVEITAGQTDSAEGKTRYGAGAQGKVLIGNLDNLREDLTQYPFFLRPGNARTDMTGGLRAMYPYLGANGKNGSMLGWFCEMENHFPKAVRCERNHLSFDIWPEWAGELRVRRGQSKEHDLYVSLFHQARDAQEMEAQYFDHEIIGLGILGGGSAPLELTLDDDYVRSCEVLELHRWLPYDEERYFAIEAKLPDPSILATMIGAGKGMMDYGDYVNADRSWAHNNENDAILDLIREYYRRGDATILALALAKARHNAHVDFIAFDPDPLREGAMPAHCPEHTDGAAYPSHLWVDGLFAAHNISGNPDFLDVALRVGENLLRWKAGNKEIFYADSRECGWPFLAFLRLHEYTRDEKWLDACDDIYHYYRDHLGPDGEIKYALPHGVGTELAGYGEFIAWRALFFYYERTGKIEVKDLLVSMLDKVYLKRPKNFVIGWAVNDLFPAWAAYHLTGDDKYIEDNYPFFQFLMQRPGNFPWGGVDLNYYLAELHRRDTLARFT